MIAWQTMGTLAGVGVLVWTTTLAGAAIHHDAVSDLVRTVVADSAGRWDAEERSIAVTRSEGAPSTKLVAADGAINALFGISVAISGDTALVGSLFIDGVSGAAYVFTRSGGAWDAGTKLVAPDATNTDLFGSSVSISGDTLVVGALGAGAAYVFTRSGGAWDAGIKLLPPDAAGFADLGDVAISGDTLVVGAAGDDDAGTDSGAVYVFTRSAGVWDAGTKLVAADGAAGDGFGAAAAISGDTLVAGAGLDDNAGGVDAGSAYVFTRTGGVWDAGTKLVAAVGATNERFGLSVAIAGDVVVAGAPNDDDGGQASGAAYVFTRDAGVWDAGIKLVAADSAALDFFGLAVAVFGEAVTIGAPFDDDAGINSGSAYLFTRSGGAWNAGTKLVAFDADATDEFGSSVAISADTVLVGAPFEDNAGGSAAGSAYVFDAPALLFADGFESGDTSAWSGSVP